MASIEESRMILHNKLLDIPGVKGVYFQRPGSRMEYPCILYELSGVPMRKADNQNYIKHHNFMITVMDLDPSSEVTDAVTQLDNCRFDRRNIVDGLYHDVFTIYI